MNGGSDDEDEDTPTTKKDETKGKKGLRKKKDPNAPKRPKSAYLFFIESQMPKIREANPEMEQKHIFKQIAEKWRMMDEKSKEVPSNFKSIDFTS